MPWPRLQNKAQVCFAMGGHVIKTGMNPILIDLMEKEILTLVAMNGSGIIHDLETALTGRTSEDVAQSLTDGSFGMARETSDFLNQAIKHHGQRTQHRPGPGRGPAHPGPGPALQTPEHHGPGRPH